MSTWRGSIFGFNRAWVAPSPRTLNWYQEAVVYAHGDSVHLERFVAGAKSGDGNMVNDNHTFDGYGFAQKNARIEGGSAKDLIAAARAAPTAADLAGINDDNVLIPVAEIAAVRARAKGSHIAISVVTTGGDDHTIWIRKAALKSSLDVLHQMTGGQMQLEKIAYRPPGS